MKFRETKTLRKLRKRTNKENNEPLTAPTSNWRGRGNIKFCIFKQPICRYRQLSVPKHRLLVAAKRQTV
jgi:hypothetical protein